MRDADAIQGLWRIVSVMNHRNPVGTGATHRLFQDGFEKEIWPSVVDDGQLRVSYALTDEVDPKIITLSLFYAKKGAFPDTPNFVQRGYYRLDGNELRICWGYGNQLPAEFSDEFTIDTLERDFGPIPETRKPSGKKPLQDDLLGALAWDDNLNWFKGHITFNGKEVLIALTEKDGNTQPALGRLQHLVFSIHRYDASARQYAAEWLLDLANDWLYDAKKTTLTADQFSVRISLESLIVYSDGEVHFGYEDGGVFMGNWIDVRMDGDDNFVRAEMA